MSIFYAVLSFLVMCIPHRMEFDGQILAHFTVYTSKLFIHIYIISWCIHGIDRHPLGMFHIPNVSWVDSSYSWLSGSQTMRLLAMMTLERYVRICVLRSCSAVPRICSFCFFQRIRVDHSGSFLDDVPIFLMFMIFLIFPAMNLHLRNSKLENLTNQRQKHAPQRVPWAVRPSGLGDSPAVPLDPALVGASSPSEKYTKIWKSIGWLSHIWNGKKNVPNHQPELVDFGHHLTSPTRLRICPLSACPRWCDDYRDPPQELPDLTWEYEPVAHGMQRRNDFLAILV